MVKGESLHGCLEFIGENQPKNNKEIKLRFFWKDRNDKEIHNYIFRKIGLAERLAGTVALHPYRIAHESCSKF